MFFFLGMIVSSLHHNILKNQVKCELSNLMSFLVIIFYYARLFETNNLIIIETVVLVYYFINSINNVILCQKDKQNF